MVLVEQNPVTLNIKDRFLGRGGSFNEATPRWLPKLLGLMPVYSNVPVRELIQGAANLSGAHYDFGEVDITLWHSNAMKKDLDIPCDGFGHDKGIDLVFYSQHPRLRKKSDLYRAVEEILPPLVAHELGHLARFRQGNKADRIYKWAVHEVAAMHLQEKVYPGMLVQPIDPTEEEIQLLEQKLKEQGGMVHTTASFPEWYYGKGGFPTRGMYRLAKGWLDRYNQNPNHNPNYLFEVPTEEFIRQVAPHVLS